MISFLEVSRFQINPTRSKWGESTKDLINGRKIDGSQMAEKSMGFKRGVLSIP